MNLAKYIDNTFLKPESETDLMPKFKDTYKYGFRALCIPTNYLDLALKAKKLFPSSPTKIAIVDNFPMGKSAGIYNPFIKSCVKINEIDELDVVIPLFYLKRFGWNDVVEKFFNNYYDLNIPVKWIVEEPYWTWDEIGKLIIAIYKHYKENKIKNKVYIKSNTGFVPRKRRLAEVIVYFIAEVSAISEDSFGIKISGGVKDPCEVEHIIKMGGIVGTSKGLEIIGK